MNRRSTMSRRPYRGKGLLLLATAACAACISVVAALSQAADAAPHKYAPSLENRLRAAEQALQSGRPKDCEAILKPFAEQKDARVHSLLGRTYEAMHNPSLAILHFIKAESIDPNDLETNRGLARIYSGMGLADTALPYYERIVRLAPEDAAAWLALGRLHLKRREPMEAAHALQRAAELDPTNLAVARELDALLTGRESHTEALHVARPTVPMHAPLAAEALESTGGRP